MTVNEILKDTVQKLKSEHGIVLTRLDVSWVELNVASVESGKEVDLFNPEFGIVGEVRGK